MSGHEDAEEPVANSINPQEASVSNPEGADVDGGSNEDGEGNNADSDDYYEVERILDEEVDEEDGELYYFVRWKGYSPSNDSREPAQELAHCTDILAAWEMEKAARPAGRPPAKRKNRPRSVHSDDTDVSTFGSDARTKKKRKSTKGPKRNDEDVADDGSDSEASQDSLLAELKAKNEGTYKWKDVNTQKSPTPSDSEEGSLQSIKERERRRRKSKRDASRSPPRRFSSPVSTSPVQKPSKLQSTKTQNAPVLPSWMVKPSVNSLKLSKRKPGAVQTIPASADERRRKSVSLSRQNAWKKKSREEPAPDAGAITMFRPGDVLTAAGRTMNSGRGVDKSVGDIDAAISLAREQISPNIERRMSLGEKSPMEPSKQPYSSGRKSVTEDLTNASKTLNESSPPPNHESRQVEDIDTDGIETVWRGPSPVSSSATLPAQPPASIALSASSATRLPPPHRIQNDITRQNASGDSAPAGRPPPPSRLSSLTTPRTPSDDGNSTTNSLPTLMEDSGRTWTGELLYSTELKSLGSIRLHIPESSTRIKRVPKFSKTVLCLQKLLTIQYITRKWLSTSAHPTNKPECLSVQFQNSQSQSTLVEILKRTESVGLVIDEACTLLFFLKYNDRLRRLFIGDGTSEPIGVALLQPLELPNSLNDNSPADELLKERKMPYNGILISEKINSFLPQLRNMPYFVYSPPESLETIEIHQIMATRKAVLTHIREAVIIMIHRLYQPILNFIPSLTEIKCAGKKDIFLFGSYLDYETVDGNVAGVFGSELMKIFPSGGRICFTMDHLLENPLQILRILEYTDSRESWKVVLPSSMVVKFDKLAPVNGKHAIDIQLAIAAIQDHISSKRVDVEDYRLDGMDVDSYLPFMTFLQQQYFDSVRRFQLFHPEPGDAGLWKASGNGIEMLTPEEVERYFKVLPNK